MARYVQVRRMAAVGATMAAMAMAFGGTAASAAHAIGSQQAGCTFATDAPRYVGWANLSFRGCVLPGAAVTADCRGDVAYRWTGSSWRSVPIGECAPAPGADQVYVYPYTSGWSWIWTQQSGWLAVRSELVRIR